MLNYNCSGNKDGKIVIFINGAGVGSWMWTHQVKFLEDYNCISFDLPGHGKNADRNFSSIENCAKDIIEIIETESSGDKAIVIGHSIGAQITMKLLELTRSSISHAVIISGLNKPMPHIGRLVKGIIGMTMPLVKYRWFSKLQSESLAVPDTYFESYYSDSLLLSKETLSNIVVENMSFEYLNAMQTQSKVLVLVGSNEKKMMIDSATKTKQTIDGCVGYIMNNASHGIPYEQAKLLNEMIGGFINDNEILPNESQFSEVKALND